MSLGFLNATYVIHKVEEIYYQTDLKGKMIHKSNLIQMAI